MASLFTPVERGAEEIARAIGLDPTVGAGAAVAFFLFEFVKVSVLILAISWGMALVRRSLPMARVRAWLTTPLGRAVGYPAAAAFGAVTPFCSCSSVPLFIGFIEAGIPVGVTFAFLITSPLVNEVVVALFLASFGWKVALVYASSGILLGMIGGMVIQALRGEHLLSPFARGLRAPGAPAEPAGTVRDECCCRDRACRENATTPGASAISRGLHPLVLKTAPARFDDAARLVPVAQAIRPAPDMCAHDARDDTGCCPGAEHDAVAKTPCGCAAPVDPRAQGAFAFATGEAWGIYRQIVAYLVVALVIGAGIHGFLPEGFFADFFSSGAWWHVPVATAIGLPLYASANATVPILETLVAKGVPLGTGMALIMSAVGVSLPELVLLKRVMTVKLLALFTLVVSVGVMIVGYVFNALPAGW